MTATTTKLTLFNKALRHLGERKLASLAEAREPRRYMDDEYPDVVLGALRSGLWNFATRAIQLYADETIVPDFGYQSAFEKPCDWVRTSWISTSETFDPPLRNYRDQEGYWLANADTLYARYISKDIGGDLAKWPVDFAEYVGLKLAITIAPRITQNESLTEALEKREKTYWKRAQANDAMDEPAQPWPLGTWTTSRIRRGYIGYYSNSIKNW